MNFRFRLSLLSDCIINPAVRPLRGASLLGALVLALGWWGLMGSPVFASPAQQETVAQETAAAESTMLIQFTPDVSAEERARIIAQTGGELVSWLAPIHVAEVRLPNVEGQASMAQAAPLAEQAAVNFAEMDLTVSAAYVPDDPGFEDEAKRYALDMIQMPSAWDLTHGREDVVVAVVDSGIRLDHPAFAGRLVAGYDYVDDDEQPNDESGHGTHIAGVVAAGMNDGAGVAGVCPQCRIMPVRVLDGANLGNWSDLAKGIIFAADHGAQVINLSLGAVTTSNTLEAAIDYAQAQDVLVIAAGGNLASSQSFYPAALEGVIGVGATTMADTRWEKSGYGDAIDLTAPGDLIYSTYHDLDNMFGGYTYLSGTSIATPFVSGLAGLVLSVAPDMTAAQVTEALFLGADDLGAPGWDAEFGHGRINAYATLTAPVEPLAQSIAHLITGQAGETAPPSTAHALYLPVVAN